MATASARVPSPPLPTPHAPPLARGKLLDRLHTAEAEAERRQAVVADLERRLAEKPLVSEETAGIFPRSESGRAVN